MKNIWFLFLLMASMVLPSFAQSTPYDSTITNNSGAGITGNVVLNSTKVYLLSGFVYVRDGGTLTIPAGTIILGEYSTKGTLIIERGGKIYANGTSSKPIVFTSQNPAGSRARGDWGGVVICGKASNNQAGGDFVVEGNIGSHAGGGLTPDDNDNSGVMTYVRIEYPGVAYTINNEINGLTMAAVGRGTTIEHIQVSYSGDDSYEWFGGTVNAKYLIAYKGWDDDFDTDFGFTGKIQFAFSYRDPQMADQSKSEAFESDNDGSGTTGTPRTSPIFVNMTSIGPKRASTDVANTNFHPDFYYGIHHRRSSRHNLFNSVITGFDEGGILFDGATVLGDTANFTYKNNTWAGMTNWVGVTAGSTTPYINYLTSRSNTSLTEPNDVLFKAPFNQTSPVLVPQTGSPLLGTASFTDPKLSDAFFTPVTYRGAFSGNGAERWDIGWSNYDPQGIVYNNANVVWTSLIYLTSGDGGSKSVVIGRGNGATDGIDAAFGESDVPPFPPAGVVELRSDLGVAGATYIDIRSYDTTSAIITYTLKLQAGSPIGSAQVLSWDPNLLGAGKFTLKDGLGGVVFADVNMKTASSQIVTGLSTLVITVDPKFSLVIGVTAGWNLVSFPGINKLGMTPDLLFANRTAGYSVYAFSGGAYNVISTLQPGTGYWLNHTATGTQYNWSTSGSPTPLRGKLMYSVNTHVSANAGWNMIGSYEYNADVNFIRTMPENKRTAASIYKYTPGAGYSPVSSLTPGLGYWINLNGAATVYLPGSFAGTLGKEAATIFETLKHNNGQIVVTDAIGQSYTLYNTNASVDFKMFELPPLPPAGIFDVRFGSQRLAEDLSSMQTINLTGVVYPVTIKVSGMNLNLVDAIDGSIVNTTVNNGNSFVITDKNVNVLKVASGMITPTDYTLEQNYPNPFNPATTIKFSIPEVSDVKLTIYNALGQKVAELVNSTLEIGSYSFNWDASNVASGMYFYELSTKNFSSVKKMMLLK